MSSSDRFSNLNFDDFRRLARDESLSRHEKIGFPDSYREGYEENIFSDICAKLSNLERTRISVIDIGPGCSDLPRMMIGLCREKQNELALIDSTEMLACLPDEPFIHKIDTPFPACSEQLAPYAGKVDVILCYSVLHYIFVDASLFSFMDKALALLAPGGQMLIGDIPNVDKRKRFFSSENGIRFHHQFMRTTEDPDVRFNIIEHNQIDDAVVFSLLQRARTAGFDAYLLPQSPVLPMANRREDVFIVRP